MKQLYITIFILGTVLMHAYTQGSVSVSPTRIMLNEDESTNTITLTNTGTDSAFYEVSFVEFKMNNEGRLEKCPPNDSSIQIASPYLQVYPREIDLAPNETQTIMVRYRTNPNLRQGEYRSHIYFRVIDKSNTSNIQTQQSGFKITPLIGITIPAILRLGNTYTTATIQNLNCSKQPDSTLWANFDIIRTGNASLYGDAEVIYSPVFGTEYLIGHLKGIAAYTNISVRKVTIRLTQPEGIIFRSGHFIARYTDPNNRKRILAEQKIKVLAK